MCAPSRWSSRHRWFGTSGCRLRRGRRWRTRPRSRRRISRGNRRRTDSFLPRWCTAPSQATVWYDFRKCVSLIWNFLVQFHYYLIITGGYQRWYIVCFCVLQCQLYYKTAIHSKTCLHKKTSRPVIDIQQFSDIDIQFVINTTSITFRSPFDAFHQSRWVLVEVLRREEDSSWILADVGPRLAEVVGAGHLLAKGLVDDTEICWNQCRHGRRSRKCGVDVA